MTTEEIKKLLANYCETLYKIRQKQNIRKFVSERAECGLHGDSGGGGSGHSDRVGSVASELADIDAEIEKLSLRANAEKEFVVSAIDLVGDYIARDLMMKKYLYGMTNRESMEGTRITDPRTARRLRERAIEEIARKYKK